MSERTTTKNRKRCQYGSSSPVLVVGFTDTSTTPFNGPRIASTCGISLAQQMSFETNCDRPVLDVTSSTTGLAAWTLLLSNSNNPDSISSTRNGSSCTSKKWRLIRALCPRTPSVIQLRVCAKRNRPWMSLSPQSLQEGCSKCSSVLVSLYIKKSV